VGPGAYGTSLSQLCCEPKTALEKNRVYFLKKKEGMKEGEEEGGREGKGRKGERKKKQGCYNSRS
jgi:hypothetical protein